MSLASTVTLDLRYTLRQLRRAPGFTATAILTLALGIGASTAMYSIVRSTLLAALPYPHPTQLVGIGLVFPGEPPEAEQTGGTADLLLREATSFSAMGVSDDSFYGQNLAIPSATGALIGSQTVRSLRVSSGYLPTLGVRPLLGRTFTASEDVPGAAATAVLSENLWRRAFNADPQVLGRVIHLNGDPYTVVGVLHSDVATADTPDLWQPLHLSAKDPGYFGDNYQLIGRLKPGVSLAQAAAELNSLTPAIYHQFPKFLSWGRPGGPRKAERLWPLQQIVVSQARPSLLALSLAVLAVLLMACLNLAGLITARSSIRRPELALRSALGASRASTLRLLLTESLVLALAGSLLGLLVAHALLPLLLAESPLDLPLLHAPSIDGSAAAFAIASGCATTLIFGLLPALSVFRQRLSAVVAGSRSAGSTVPQQRVGRALLVAQVALASTLLSVGAVLLGTFLHLRAIPSGVRPQHLFALQVNLKGTAYNSSIHTQQFVAAVEEHLRAVPGVSSVATVNGLPLDRGLNNSAGPAGHSDQVRYAETRFITPGYFHTVGNTLLAGADISDADTANAQHVALINQRAASQWFPGRSAIGETIVDGGEKMRVIGLIADVHDSSLAEPAGPTVYVPYTQISDKTVKAINGWFATTFVLRTSATGNAPEPDLSRAAAAAVSGVDPEVPASKFAPMQSFIDRTVAAPRFFSGLVSAFALFALLLTVIGLFGLLSYQVASRTREIGVRMALGAQRSQVLVLVLREGLVLTAVGLCFGIAGSFALRSLLASFLVGSTRIDPRSVGPILAGQTASIAVASGVMLLAALASSFLPARRAASVEPALALRSE